MLRENLRNWFSKSHPEGNWVRMSSKGDILGPCAREPGEGKPKCLPLAKARSMSKSERAASVLRKRRKDPQTDRPGTGNRPIMVKTESFKTFSNLREGLLVEKNKPTNPDLWSRAKSLAKQKFDVYPSAYANGWAAKWYKSKGGGWRIVSEEACCDDCDDTNYGTVEENFISLGDEKYEDWGELMEEDNEGKTLNKPFLTPGGPKKRSVYVRNENGNVVKVNFGDPNLSIKRDDPERRRSFRARHNCDNPGPKWKARYWSCKFWSTTPVSKL